MAVYPSQSPGNLLQDLLGHWERQFHKRATGGWWSLVGFAFQTSTFLLRFFQQLENGGSDPGIIAMERLSDVLCPDHGRLTLIQQVKLTLTKPQLIKAVEEAYLITDLCRRETPGLLPHLRFQIACRQKETELIPANLEMSDVIQEGGDPESWQAMMGQFDVIEPVIEEPDPLGQLHTYLWSIGIENPVALVERCAGRLLKSFDVSDPHLQQRVGYDLNDFFINEKRRCNLPAVGALLTKEEVELLASDEAEILIGKKPTLEHLRKGFFRERPQIFQLLWERFQQWLSMLDSAESEKIPVFWMGGRSGEGKSILLLQLIAQFLRSRPYDPLLLLNGGEELPDLLKRVPSQVLFSGQFFNRIFAVVDDVYDLNDRDEWSRKVEAAFIRRTPPVVLITCGPTEQREQFERNLREQFDVTHFELPHLMIDECKAFLAWYESRTGKSRNLNQLTTENPLLVQFMFELASLKGATLQSFAQNFKRRLSRLKVFDETRAILAVNALYMNAPSNLLVTTESRSALKRLSEKDQYHFLWTHDLETSKDGVLLAHAHLAWLLFAEWARFEHPLTLAEVWARELAKCMKLFDRYKPSIKNNNLLGQLFYSIHLSDDEDTHLTANRRELIRELYRLHIADHDGMPASSTLSKWLEMESKIPDLQLLPDPVECAVVKLSDEAGALELHGSVVGWLWLISESKTAPEAEQLQKVVKHFVNRNPDNPGIGRALALIFGRSKNNNLARQLIDEWLLANATHPQAHFVIAPVIKDNPTDAEVRQLAATWLSINGEHAQARHVIAPLITTNPNDVVVKRMAIDWIANHEDLPQAYWLLASIVKANPNDAAVQEIALYWITNNEEHPKVHYVFAPLVAAHPTDAAIRKYAVAWLATHKQYSQAYQLMSAVVRANSTDSEVMELAVDWLTTNGQLSQAYQVISPLVKANPTNAELKELALDWLAANEKQAHTYNLLAVLLKANPTDEGLKRLADNWLDVCLAANKLHRRHQHAYQFITPLVAANPADTALRALAIDWLVANEKHPHAYNLLAALVHANPTDEEVKRRAIAWLKENEPYPKAYNLPTALVKANPTDAEVRELALGWLESNEQRPQACQLITTLVGIYPTDAEVRRQAVDWLTVNGQHPQAFTVLAALAKANPADKAVMEMSLNWLEVNEQRPQALSMLAALVKVNPDNVEVRRRAIDWLEVNEERPEADNLLAALVKANPADVVVTKLDTERIEVWQRKGKRIVISFGHGPGRAKLL